VPERDVLNLLAEGRPPKVIARGLGISINACRAHIRAVFDKLGVHNQMSAVEKAARAGLLNRPSAGPPDEPPVP
jgi:DNA-binding CsgD family transcriptional regulator